MFPNFYYSLIFDLSKSPIFVSFCEYLLDIHLLVVQVSAWGLDEIMRYVLLCSDM